MKIITGGVTAAKGFQAASTAAGIKYQGRTDMAMVYSEKPCVAAGTFTTNIVKAAPVKWDQEIVYQHPSAQVIICNSGIANACTGEEGFSYCRATAKAAAETLNVDENSVLVASTGVIGMQLPIQKLADGVKAMVPKLQGTLEAGNEAAKAIMTTDTKEKEVKRLRSHVKELRIPDYDYQKITVPTKKTTLVTNPTTIYGKEPIVFETLKQLMLQANQKVFIHTPYAVFSKEMYEGISQVKEQVPDTTMILNSIASGDNICASADYKKNRSEILDTGISLYEYMGRHSTHGKSLIIDDDIAIVGSYNLDCRSTYVDTETMLVVHGQEITKQLEEDFNGLKKRSLQVKKDGSYQKNKNVKESTIDGRKQGMIKVLSYIIQAFRYLA